jgi:hypothetical protein
MTFSGNTPGANIQSGGLLGTHAPKDSPILAAYEWYVGRGSTSRKSWDPTTMLYAVLGLKGSSALGLRQLFEYTNDRGHNKVLPDGSNEWITENKTQNQHILQLADGVSNSSIGWLLDQLYIRNPIQKGLAGPDFTQADLYNTPKELLCSRL